ncbi:MAG: hypothetical protein K2H46_07045, partial [Muribaculaceae bacterium]|nr:hypothetical protein [Muribaculaceae bacterium]
MATYDDILDGRGFKLPSSISPSPIDASMQGSQTSVGSEPKSSIAKLTPLPKETVVEASKRSVAQDSNKTVESPGKETKAEFYSENPQKQRRMSYVDMFEAMNPDKPETEEEKAKREKKEKREAMLTSIGDGIAALSNLWFTSQYAPSMFDASKSRTATTKERWERLRQQRESNRRLYLDGYMRARALDEANEKDDRNWRHTIVREKIADARYEVKAAQDKALADLNEKLKNQQITAAEYKAEQERIKAQYADQNEKLDLKLKEAGITLKKAQTGAANASAGASRSRARYYDNGGGGGKHGPTLQLEDDQPLQFSDDKDYDRTVMRLAPDYGVPTTVEVNTGKTVMIGPNLGQPIKKTVKRDVKDIAADIEREAAKRKKANQNNNTMPGVGGNGSSSNT